MTESLTFKDQGNKEYKEGNWLRAAALYTKGLKNDPKNKILLSNRSAALLKLNKVQKALADANECVQIDSSWDKGHFRRANVLEVTKKYKEALDAYQAALKCNPDSKEVANKVKALSRLIRSPASQSRPPQATANGSITTQQQYDSAQAGLTNGSSIPKSTQRIEDFFRQTLDLVETEIQNKTFDRTFPSVYFLPGIIGEDGREQTGQVSTHAAFDSPDTLANATGFLRQYAIDTAAQAAVAIVPKHKIAFPQVWQKPGWPHGRTDGIFVQMQSQGGPHRLYFVPLGQKSREPLPLKDKFSIVESLLR